MNSTIFLVNFVVEVDIFTKNPKFQSVSNFCRNQGWLSNVYVWLIWAETWPIRLKLSMISELWLVKTPQICLLFLKSSQFQIKIACALKIVKCIFLRNLFRGENIDVLRTHMLTSHKRGKKGNMSVSWVTILCTWVSREHAKLLHQFSKRRVDRRRKTSSFWKRGP